MSTFHEEKHIDSIMYRGRKGDERRENGKRPHHSLKKNIECVVIYLEF